MVRLIDDEVVLYNCYANGINSDHISRYFIVYDGNRVVISSKLYSMIVDKIALVMD